MILNTGIFSSTGTGTRSIGFGSSILSGSVAFNGTNQYLNTATSTALTLTGDFTIECWFYDTNIAANESLYGKRPDSATYGGVSLYHPSSSNITFLGTTTGSTWEIQFNSSIATPANMWHHVAVTRSGNVYTMWVNGQLAGTQTEPGAIFANPAIPFTIGAGAQDGSFPWSGYISNFRIVNGVAVYTGNFTVPASPLTATQSSGTNISAITGVQTSLLLNTVYGTSFLTDSSTYNLSITNNGTATKFLYSPFVGVVNLTHTTAATTVLNMATVTGFTYTGFGGFAVADMANTRTLTFGTTGGSTTTAVNLTFTTGASVATLTTASWFNNLDFGTTSFTLGTTTLNINGGLVLSSSGTYTGLTPSFRFNSTLTSNGKTVAALVVNAPTYTLTTNDATSITGALTLTAGALVAPYNITSASFLSAGPYSKSITGSTTTYTITGAGATAWSFGSTGSALFNGSTQNFSVATNAAFDFASSSFTIEAWVYLNATGTAQCIQSTYPAAFAGTTGYEFLTTTSNFLQFDTFLTGVNQTITATNQALTSGVWTHVAVVNDAGTYNLYVNGTQCTYTSNITQAVNSGGAAVTFGRSLYTSFQHPLNGYMTNIRVVKGVAVYTGNFTVPTAPLLPTQSSGTNISAITGTQTSLLLSTPSNSLTTDYSVNNFTVTNTGTATANILSPFAVTSPGITFTSFTISMTAATAKTFAGGGATYPTLNQGGAGALTISGNNSFADLTATTRPSTITFTISTTQTFTNFTLSGTAGNLVTINSSSAGTQASLSKTSGTVSVGFLSIRDSNATGGAGWYAGTTSTNVSNNTGWIFTAPSGYTAGGLFFAFF